MQATTRIERVATVRRMNVRDVELRVRKSRQHERCELGKPCMGLAEWVCEVEQVVRGAKRSIHKRTYLACGAHARGFAGKHHVEVDGVPGLGVDGAQ